MWPWRKRRAEAARPATAAGCGLRVLDDFFPNLLTGFRVAEYNAYLARWPALVVLSAQPDFGRCHADYARVHPQAADRVRPFAPEAVAGARLVYLNFLNNAVRFLPALAAHGVPFLLTLYPGGGFGLDDSDSDRKLRTVLTSTLLRALVVTAPATGDYLARFAAREGIALPPVTAIPGVVVNPLYFESRPPRAYFGHGKPAADVCFVAARYMERGENKGYPQFIAAARAVAAEFGDVTFHVVGDFTPEDVPLDALAPRVRFHGTLATRPLRDFLLGMDAIVSPNRAFVLHPGNFDGFPTGACVEAALAGVALLATDPLRQNRVFRAGEDWIPIEPDAASITPALRALQHDPARLRRVALAGRAVAREHYAPQRQIDARIALIERELAAPGTAR
jgi:lipopolysaccharide transport system ATP-binding protein